MNMQTIAWVKNKIKIIDQTELPNKFKYIYIRDLRQLEAAIKTMKIRGAPALAAAGALGLLLAAQNSRAKNIRQLKSKIEEASKYLAGSRPTAVNLFWGLKRMLRALEQNKGTSLEKIKYALSQEAKKILAEDRAICRQIGEAGWRLIKDNDKILTLCNTGMLATVDYGTALGIIYRAKEKGRRFGVYACETRPLFQGARLTTWELKKNGIDTTLICDNSAATLMRKKVISKVFVGADRIARNGDTANKVGTYNLAVLAKWHTIPFYIAAPISTIDFSAKSGKDIIIEERSDFEVTHNFFKRPIAPAGIKVFNPAFDVTPYQLISGIITEKGLFLPNALKKIRNL